MGMVKLRDLSSYVYWHNYVLEEGDHELSPVFSAINF